MTDGGVTLRPEGAVGLLHRKGSPVRCWESKRDVTGGGTLTASEGSCGSAAPEGRVPLSSLMRGAVWRVGRRAPVTTEGSQRLCCAGSGSPVRHQARSATRNDGRRRNTATGGSRGSAAPEGEPRPMLKKQRGATDGGTLTASEGSCGSAAPEGRVPLATWCKARFDASEEGLPLQPKGASGSAAPGVGAPSATQRAAQPGMTDGGVTLRPEGAVGLLHRKGSPVRCWRSKETRLMEGLSLRPKGAAALLHRRGESPLRLDARRGLTRRKKGSHYNRREPAALLHREWEPRPPPSAQRNPEWRTEA